MAEAAPSRRWLIAALAVAPWLVPLEADAQERVEPLDLPAASDEVAPEPVSLRLGDRILAIVGDNLLLESEWLEQTLLLTDQIGLRGRSPEFDRVAVETYAQMLNNLVIVSVAERDTAIQLDEQAVLDEVDREIEQIRRQFPSEAEFQRELQRSQWGSLAAYRADLQERKRREMIGQLFLEMRRDEIKVAPVSDATVREYWEENRQSFGTRPVSLPFEEIAITVKPSDAAREAAREEAERILAEIEAGLEFGAAAERYSDDPGSSEERGDLGWFGRGRMVAAFEDAAFEATPGEIVGPVESPFGYHIIQVIDRRPEERRARHVLVAFERTDEDRARTRAEAEAIASAVLAGADVDSLQSIHMAGDSAAAEVIDFPAGQLPPQYRRSLENLQTGETDVIETATGYSVVVSRGASGGGEITFEEMAPRIREQLEQEAAEEAFVDQLSERVYVEVRVPPERALAEL